MDPFSLRATERYQGHLKHTSDRCWGQILSFGQTSMPEDRRADVTPPEPRRLPSQTVSDFEVNVLGLKLSDRKGMPISNLVVFLVETIFELILIHHIDMRFPTFGYFHLLFFFSERFEEASLPSCPIISTAGHFSSVGYGGFQPTILGYGNFFLDTKI